MIKVAIAAAVTVAGVMAVTPVMACNHKTVWQPQSGNSIHLDNFTGVIYYTVEQAGLHVVATLVVASDEPEDDVSPQSIRFEATLAPNAHTVISVPQAEYGKPPIAINIMRAKDDTLLVDYSGPYCPVD